MSQTQLLYRLQTLDSQIDRARRELGQIEAELGESEALKSATATVEQAGEALRQVQTKQTDLELEVQSLSAKISNQENLLYSGKGLSAKEAANLQDEIASLRRWHGNREELLLETMVEAEEKEDHFNQAQTHLSSVKSAWQTGQADLVERQAELKREIEGLLNQRPTIAGSISPDKLNEYESLRAKKGGLAVAGVKNNLCQACSIMVSNHKVQQARAGMELFYCGTCGRILHIL